MARHKSRLATFAYALAIGLGLLFGAREALASSGVFGCQYDGYNWLGACTTPEACTASCQAVGSGESIGQCWGVYYCCRCFH